MARKNRKPDTDPATGELGTGTVISPPKHSVTGSFEDKKTTTFGLAEITRGGPAARSGTKQDDLRDFGESH